MQPDARGKNRPIAYASRSLTPAESNYSVTHQETLAVVWALKYFRDIILGYSITVYTDHAAVTELFKGKNLTGRLASSLVVHNNKSLILLYRGQMLTPIQMKLLNLGSATEPLGVRENRDLGVRTFEL